MTDSKKDLKTLVAEACEDPSSPLYGCEIVDSPEGGLCVVQPKNGDGKSALAELMRLVAGRIEEKGKEQKTDVDTHMLLVRMLGHYREDLAPKTLLAFQSMSGLSTPLTPLQEKWVLDEARRLGIAP